MILRSIRLQSFRNHTQTTLEPCEKVNVLIGRNGEGKTSLLEAISFVCVTRGLYGTADAVAVKKGEDSFCVEGELNSDVNVPLYVRVEYNIQTGQKGIYLNKLKPDRLSDIIGLFPLVTLSPDHAAITKGGPAERRKFIDLALSQTSRSYLETILEYRRILRHRNKLLLDTRHGKSITKDTLDPWNTSLVQTGAAVITKRQGFIREFSEPLHDAYGRFVETREKPKITYRPSVEIEENEGSQSIAEKLALALQKTEREERRLGSTLVGPHRDELMFTLNNMDIRTFASQGQHKTFLVALKIAEYYYLVERTKETPMLLLDDVFSELDEERVQQVLDLIEQLGQTFVTTVDDRMFRPGYDLRPEYRRFRIKNGTVDDFHAQTVIN